MSLSKLFQRIIWHNNTTPAINEDNLNAMSKAIDDIDDRVILIGDDVVTVIPQIQAYLEQAESIVEAVEELSQNPPYIGANGNWYVFDTTLEAYKDSGVDASITVDIADITMIAVGAQPYVTNTGTSTDPVFHLFLPQSPQGATGNGIANIAKTGTQGLVDTYTITMTDGTTYTFTVTNGQGIGDMTKAVYDSTNAVADAGGIVDYVEGELGTLPYTNPNLLDNPWFTVNQRRQSSYTGLGYTYDRWYHSNADCVTAKSNGVITLSHSTASWGLLIQRVEDDVISSLRGKDLTLSIMMANGEIKSITKQFPSSTPSQSEDYYYLQISNDALLLFRYDSGGFWDVRVALLPTANTSVSFKAVKLELGSVSTLAQDTAPNYATELLKCQRYFYRHKGAYEYVGYFNTTTNFRANLALPVPMRAIPSMTLETPTDYAQCAIYDAQGNAVHPSAIAVDTVNSIVGQPEILLNSTVPTHTQNMCGVQRFNLRIDLSADL